MYAERKAMRNPKPERKTSQAPGPCVHPYPSTHRRLVQRLHIDHCLICAQMSMPDTRESRAIDIALPL